MDTPIKDFCEKYKEKLKNDKDIAQRELDHWVDYRDRISFYVLEYGCCPGAYRIGSGYMGTTMFQLDKEDLEYLYNKYSKKVRQEMKERIEEIKEDYENI